jgi:hypothetical protein
VRIPFPERVPISGAAVFAVALFLVQWLEGTTLFFSAGCVAFIMISALAFNSAGGLSRAAGAYVFFYSTLVVIVGLCYKAYLGEPAHTNLTVPNTDIEAYVGSITAMYAAVIVSRRFARKSSLLQHLLPEAAMYRASVGCIVFGIFGSSVIQLLGPNAGVISSLFSQLNQLIPLGIIIGVMYEIRRSGGTRCVNTPILFAVGYYFCILGLLDFSKQGMLLPLFCVMLPVCALRYRVSPAQIVSGVVGTFVIFHYLVPYAQYGRGFREDGQTFSQKVTIAARLLEHPEDTRRAFNDYPGGAAYFNTPQGFWDRLQFISVDDGLNQVTASGRIFGISPVIMTFENVVPHFLWHDKPGRNFGAAYTHEITGVPEEDLSGIGISYSPTAEAFHMAGWVGIFVVAPLVWFMLFTVFDALFGDLRSTPWGLLAMAMISHTAPEGSLIGSISLFTTGSEILIFCALFASYAAPLFGDALLGPNRLRVPSHIPFRRLPAPRSSVDTAP